MTIEEFSPDISIKVSAAAREHILKELQKSEDSRGMRLYLKTSGCSGYMYETELTPAAASDEETFEIAPGLLIFVPRKDLPVLAGTEIDFITRGLNSMFQFKNPNVTAECGCGESFSVS